MTNWRLYWHWSWIRPSGVISWKRYLLWKKWGPSTRRPMEKRRSTMAIFLTSVGSLPSYLSMSISANSSCSVILKKKKTIVFQYSFQWIEIVLFVGNSGYIFNVLEESIIMAAGLSSKNIFTSPYHEKLEAYLVKTKWLLIIRPL